MRVDRWLDEVSYEPEDNSSEDEYYMIRVACPTCGRVRVIGEYENPDCCSDDSEELI